MMNSSATQEWERAVILELQREHARICKERKIFLRPLLFHVDDLESDWAQYDTWTRTVRFSKKLLHQHTWFQVLGVLRHQMAHQYMAESGIQNSRDNRNSDEKFVLACARLGVLPQFQKLGRRLAMADLDWRNEKQNQETERILDKIRKLLSLAQSNNEHEAMLAMTRVREIYARHNLEQMPKRTKGEFVHWVISTDKKRFEAWELKVLSILIAFFFVRVLTLEQFEVATAEKKQAFELIGSRENVLMAEYVYHFLCQQIDHLLTQNPSLKGLKLSRLEKNSYRLGILDGFAKKLSASLAAPPEAEKDSKSLIVVQALAHFRKDPLLNEHIAEVYPHLGQRAPKATSIDLNAFEKGHQAGKKITLHKPISEGPKSGFGGYLKSTSSFKPA